MKRIAFSVTFASLVAALHAAEPPAPAQLTPDRIRVALEALQRLKGIDPEQNPAVKAVLLKVLEATRGTPDFVGIVRDFKVKDQEAGLLEVAQKNPANPAGIDAMRMLLDNTALLRNALNEKDAAVAAATAQALGNTADKRGVPVLLPLVADPGKEIALRKSAVAALAQSAGGAAALLKLANDDRLPADVKLTASTALHFAPWPKIKAEAANLLPLPSARGDQPLPSVAELVKMRGDATRGAAIFARDELGCMSCHRVNGKGADFGPDLSEIGTKLGRDALCESILNPNAGVSVGYETTQLDLKSGDQVMGILASETGDELVMKQAQGIANRYPKSGIAGREKLPTSIMPSGLQQALTTQEFVDLVEYLSSLKTAGK